MPKARSVIDRGSNSKRIASINETIKSPLKKNPAAKLEFFLRFYPQLPANNSILRHGNTPMKRDLMRKHLDIKEYQNGYVTLDIQDWFMASLVNDGVKAGRKLNKQKLCLAYSEMIWDTMVFYDTKATELLERSPKHMLLLHENDLAAMCVDTLIAKIKLNGWKIISPEVAMENEIYKRNPNTLFNNNGQIAALYFETTGIKLNYSWGHPWEDGKVIREEFERRDVFEK